MGIFKKKEEEQKFYRLDRIDETSAQYRIAIGERSNGKSYAVLERILENYCNGKGQGAYIRRYRDDFVGQRGQQVFAGLVANNRVRQITNSEWENIKYKSGAWYLTKWDEELNKDVWDEDPFCYAFSLASYEHDKSTSYPNITTIAFDEFLSRTGYLTDEFVIFMNVVSTIIRSRDNVVVYMMANTVAITSPYFTEMGIKQVNKMKPGDLQVYEYGDSGLKVAIELCENNASKGKPKPSDKYFAFNSPQLKMITHGEFELVLSPHCPCKYKPNDIRYNYFIEFDENILQCEIVYLEDMHFTYIHRKTTPIQNENEDLIYSCDWNARPNRSRNLLRPRNKREQSILRYYQTDNVFYQDNEVGELVKEYIDWCKKN